MIFAHFTHGAQSDHCSALLCSALLSIIMTISSTLLALVLMPLCLWIYSRAWINTPVVNLMPFGAIILTLCSTLIPIGLGVMLRYRYTRVADIVLKVNWEEEVNTKHFANK